MMVGAPLLLKRIKAVTAVVVLLGLCACSSKKKRPDFTRTSEPVVTPLIEPAPAPQKDKKPEPPLVTLPQKNPQLQIQIDRLVGQISQLDKKIASTQDRLSHFQISGVIGKEGMIAGAQEELASYQSQKSSLEQKKQALLSELLRDTKPSQSL